MSINLGTCATKGNSDVITSYKVSASATVQPGKLAVIATDGTVINAASTNLKVIGVAGYTENGRVSVIEAGLDVGVLLASESEAPAIGAPVYMDANGLITTSAIETTPLNAIFKTNYDATIYNVATGALVASSRAARISFVGGL